MAGRPAYCRCNTSDFDSRWTLDEKSHVRCKDCNGAPPHHLVARATKAANDNLVARVTVPLVVPTNPGPRGKEKAIPQDAKQEAISKMAAVLNAKKGKDDTSKQKTRKVGKAKVTSKLPAKTGGSVTGQTGDGYIFADEPTKIYVVGTGWFGSWNLKDVEYREPGDKVTSIGLSTADIAIKDINDWNSIGSALVNSARALKGNMLNNGAVYDAPYSATGLTAEFCGLTGKDSEVFVTGIWHKDDVTDVTFAIIKPMWEIL